MAKSSPTFELDAITDPDAGRNTKAEAIAKLEALSNNVDAVLALRKSNGHLQRAINEMRKGRIARGAQLALEAVNADDSNSYAYHVLGQALEKMGYLYKALVTFEKAYQLNPNDPDVILDLGHLAGRFKMNEIAEKLNRQFIAIRPDSPLGYNNLAHLLNGMNRGEEAIDILRDAINRLPNEAILWSALATVLTEEGRAAESIVFHQEALRLDPANRRHYYNLAYTFMHLGRTEEAVALFDEVIEKFTDPTERLESIYAHSICQLQAGRLEEGFTEYEVHNDHRFRCYAQYLVQAPLWQGEPLAGKTVLVVGEQGLGDEIMFANILPDLAAAVGPQGRLMIAVERRLVELFTRTYPGAVVGAYEDRKIAEADGDQELRFFPLIETAGAPDYYLPMGSALKFLRRRIEDFSHRAFLKPDSERVEHFRAMLGKRGPGPTVGICWRSMMLTMKRGKYYSSLDQWGPILRTPGVRFVNLQYGDSEKELAEAETLHGVHIERIEGHDLTSDIDGNAALSAALDLVISAPTAAAAVAGSVGTETWFLMPGIGWPMLGTDEYPWYRKTRTFRPEVFADWDDAVGKIAEALRDFSAAY
jgi:tetratricopeptide (TPR) repeat protein